ncbi:MAG: hypothetical protein D3926_02430 [Desulfobacteraceae bacterium]|nr:MAG: hypothetical protein D3926_02430 [Desulfobacteraceae bacterium]
MSKSYDPQMHTAEHLLNQVMVRTFDCGRCFSAHINKKKSKCDYRFDRALSQDEVAQIENMVNQAIQQDLPVRIEHLDFEQARQEFSLDRVPSKETLDSFRIVRIGDFDACPCIGPHVSSTLEIGSFRIISTDFNDQVLRVRFKLS